MTYSVSMVHGIHEVIRDLDFANVYVVHVCICVSRPVCAHANKSSWHTKGVTKKIHFISTTDVCETLFFFCSCAYFSLDSFDRCSSSRNTVIIITLKMTSLNSLMVLRVYDWRIRIWRGLWLCKSITNDFTCWVIAKGVSLNICVFYRVDDFPLYICIHLCVHFFCFPFQFAMFVALFSRGDIQLEFRTNTSR